MISQGGQLICAARVCRLQGTTSWRRAASNIQQLCCSCLHAQSHCLSIPKSCRRHGVALLNQCCITLSPRHVARQLAGTKNMAAAGGARRAQAVVPAESQHTHLVSSHTDSRKHALFRTSAVIAKAYGPCSSPATAAWQPCMTVLLGSEQQDASPESYLSFAGAGFSPPVLRINRTRPACHKQRGACHLSTGSGDSFSSTPYAAGTRDCCDP